MVFSTGEGHRPPSDKEVSQDSREVVLNFDNDNGSVVQDYIPQVRDFDAGTTAAENDTVPLVLVDSNPPPGITRLLGFTQYRVDVTYHGEGRIKIWNTGTKEAEIPLGAWTTAHMLMEDDGVPRWLPGFFMEGTIPSRFLNDITINLQLEALMGGGIRLITCEPIAVSVTPILVDMYSIDVERPTLRLTKAGEATTDATQATWMQAQVQFEAKFIPALPVPGKPAMRHGFIQFLTDFANGLPGGHAIKFENNSFATLHISTQQPGPNMSLPFLDALEDTQLPFYQDPVGQPGSNPGDGTKIISMGDSPGAAFWSSMTEIDFAYAFRTHFAVMSFESSLSSGIVFPYGYIDWDCHFRFTDWSAMTGVTTNLSTVQIGSFSRSHAISRLAPSLFNDALLLS